MSRPKTNGEISVYSNYFELKPIMTGDIMTYLHNVKDGLWQEEVEEARKFGKDHDMYDKIKSKLTSVTISGVFDGDRLDSSLKQHSGFICMDFDSIPDIEQLELALRLDRYTFAVFRSISNKGLAVIVKISKPDRHKDIFRMLREYYLSTYMVEADKKCINVSRLRGASYDPECFVNTDSEAWSKLTGLNKIKKPPPKSSIIATNTDFNNLIEDIKAKNIDITDGYENWLSCGFALADHFGESGRQFFHDISAIHSDYDYDHCDKQFTHCLNSDNASKITIGTFYYLCKNQGLQVSSNLTREAVNIVSVKRAAGAKKEDVEEHINHLDLSNEDRQQVIDQVYKSPINRQFSEDLPLAERVELYIVNTYNIRINELGGAIEIDGVPMDQRKPNQLWLECLKFVDEKTSNHLVKAALDSDKIKAYNPITEFFDINQSIYKQGTIDKFLECLPSSTTLGKLDEDTYKRLFFKKWFVGMVAGIYGVPNPMVLCLLGRAHGTGKTEFFRRLFPEELKRFTDEATIDSYNNRDNAIKLSKNIFILDDEGNSKNYKESQKFKALMSSTQVKHRALYKDVETYYKRIASFGVTSNELGIINDNTGNRRIIPMEIVDRIDRDIYNSIDKKDLIMEAWHMYKDGYNYSVNEDEIDMLSNDLEKYENDDPIIESILYCGRPGMKPVPCAAVYDYLCTRFQNQRFSPQIIGRKMKVALFDVKSVKDINGVVQKCYFLDDRFSKSVHNHCTHSDMEFNYDYATGKIKFGSNKPL